MRALLRGFRIESPYWFDHFVHFIDERLRVVPPDPTWIDLLPFQLLDIQFLCEIRTADIFETNNPPTASVLIVRFLVLT